MDIKIDPPLLRYVNTQDKLRFLGDFWTGKILLHEEKTYLIRSASYKTDGYVYLQGTETGDQADELWRVIY